MKNNRADRENDKFADVNGKTTIQVSTIGDSFTANIEFDEIRVLYPTSSSERYDYYLQNVLVCSILVTYSDETKETLLNVKRI